MKMVGMRRKVFSLGCTAVIAAAMLSGCGGGDPDRKPTAKVTGKVTLEGAPIAGGSLIFAPMGDGKSNIVGKSGQATIKSDGTYTVSTYGTDDGAIIGKHRVLFSPPPAAPPSATAAHDAGPPADPLSGMVPKQPEVDVAKGGSQINIELVKQSAEPPK
jgi:hypothetical protein